MSARTKTLLGHVLIYVGTSTLQKAIKQSLKSGRLARFNQ